MLADQKHSKGGMMTFFGYSTMAATAPTSLSLKHNVPILCCRMTRAQGAHFHFKAGPILYPTPNKTAEEMMQEIYQTFEQWIREDPAQWMWVHRRWKAFHKIEESGYEESNI